MATANRILTRLSRVTSDRAFIAEIDGLRFFAIISVVLFHLNGYMKHYSRVGFAESPETSTLNSLLGQGHFGVQLFFVISGFILAVPFAEHYMTQRSIPSLGKYFKRRLIRLEPPYIVNLVILFVLLLIVNQENGLQLLPHLLASMGYVHNAIYLDGSTDQPCGLVLRSRSSILHPCTSTDWSVPGPSCLDATYYSGRRRLDVCVGLPLRGVAPLFTWPGCVFLCRHPFG